MAEIAETAKMAQTAKWPKLAWEGQTVTTHKPFSKQGPGEGGQWLLQFFFLSNSSIYWYFHLHNIVSLKFILARWMDRRTMGQTDRRKDMVTFRATFTQLIRFFHMIFEHFCNDSIKWFVAGFLLQMNQSRQAVKELILDGWDERDGWNGQEGWDGQDGQDSRDV